MEDGKEEKGENEDVLGEEGEAQGKGRGSKGRKGRKTNSI